MPDRLLQDIGHLLNVIRRRARDKRRPCRLRHVDHIEFLVDVHIGRSRRHGAVTRQRRILPARHPVDPVVHHDRRHIDVPPAGMDEVVSPDGQGVAIAHRHQKRQFRAAHLHPDGECQRPTVECVQRMKIQVSRNPGRTSDAGNHHDVVLFQPHILDRAQKTIEHDPVPAARTPDMRKEPLPEIVPYGHVRLLFPGSGGEYCGCPPE